MKRRPTKPKNAPAKPKATADQTLHIEWPSPAQRSVSGSKPGSRRRYSGLENRHLVWCPKAHGFEPCRGGVWQKGGRETS